MKDDKLANVVHDKFMGQVYPSFIPEKSGFAVPGISLRDYIAIHASETDIACMKEDHIRCGIYKKEEKTRIEYRYMFADAMLKERDK